MSVPQLRTRKVTGDALEGLDLRFECMYRYGMNPPLLLYLVKGMSLLCSNCVV